MHHPLPLDPAGRELEKRLASLTPAPHGIRRDTLMFRAGQEAGRKQASRWRAISAVMGVMACASVTPWIMRSPAKPAPKVVLIDDGYPVLAGSRSQASRQPAESVVESLPPRVTPAYLRLRDQVLRQGVDALPSAGWAPMGDAALVCAGSLLPTQGGMPPAHDPLDEANFNDQGKRS